MNDVIQPTMSDRAAAPHNSMPQLASFDYARDRRLQRRAMRSMWLAMPVMVLGLPAHLAVLGSHAAHQTGWMRLLVWLAWTLTSATIWTAREQLALCWQRLRRAQLAGDDLVVLGALAAYVVSLPALSTAHGAPMYFDVTAMALGWLVAGAAQRSDLERRYVTMCDQLALFDREWLPSSSAIEPPRRAGYVAALSAGVLIAAALLAFGWQVRMGEPLSAAWAASFAFLAAICPCTLGIARSSAYAAGAERAAAAGWIAGSAAAFRADGDPRGSAGILRLGTAAPEVFAHVARTVRRAARLNTGWAIGFNLLLVPLALCGPVDPLLPAALMLLSWLLITLTSRSIGRWSHLRS